MVMSSTWISTAADFLGIYWENICASLSYIENSFHLYSWKILENRKYNVTFEMMRPVLLPVINISRNQICSNTGYATEISMEILMNLNLSQDRFLENFRGKYYNNKSKSWSAYCKSVKKHVTFESKLYSSSSTYIYWKYSSVGFGIARPLYQRIGSIKSKLARLFHSLKFVNLLQHHNQKENVLFKKMGKKNQECYSNWMGKLTSWTCRAIAPIFVCTGFKYFSIRMNRNSLSEYSVAMKLIGTSPNDSGLLCSMSWKCSSSDVVMIL